MLSSIGQAMPVVRLISDIKVVSASRTFVTRNEHSSHGTKRTHRLLVVSFKMCNIPCDKCTVTNGTNQILNSQQTEMPFGKGGWVRSSPEGGTRVTGYA